MSSNTDLIRKADIAVADLQTNGGYLNPEQADTFIRKLLKQPTMLAQTRRVVMSAPERKINKIQFASRILKPAVSATPLDAADRSKPTTEQITLNTKEYIAEVRIPYDVIEDNIERGNIGQMTDVGGSPMSGGLKDTIVTLIAERVALDLEELSILGDTGSGDAYLATTNGWLARFTSNIVDAGGAPISRTILKNVVKAMPSQYRRNLGGLKHFLATEQVLDYRDTLAARETSLGDAQLQSTATVYAAGVPVEGVALMPGARGILTHPQNLIFGIQRDIMMETDKDITSRVYIIVVTCRVAFQVEEELAGVKLNNLAT